VRQVSAMVLGRCGDACGGHAGTVVQLMCDRDVGVRLAAIEATGKLGTEGARFVDAIADQTRDARSEVRLAAVAALGKLGPAALATVAHRLVQLLSDRKVRTSAVRVLGKLDLSSLEPHADAIAEHLRSADAPFRKEARLAFGDVCPSVWADEDAHQEGHWGVRLVEALGANWFFEVAPVSSPCRTWLSGCDVSRPRWSTLEPCSCRGPQHIS